MAEIKNIGGQPVFIEKQITEDSAKIPEVAALSDMPSIAAEKLRSNNGYSATDILLGLNLQPSTLGILHAPPGNVEALRHLTPLMRRTILRNLLSKQREKMRELGDVMRDKKQNPESENTKNSNNDLISADFQNRRALQDLQATTRMLDLLDKLLEMQDYTLSRMGTFAQG